MKLEIDIEEDACAKALALGVINVKMKAAGHNGWPDRMFMIPGGRPLLIEFKNVGESPPPLQQVMHRRLKHYGYQVEVCDSVDEAIGYIKRALSRSIKE